MSQNDKSPAGGGLERAIDFEKLKQMLADHVREGEEAYEFTWVGKKAAIVEANRPIRRTLRPCVEESKDWDTTQNLYIEGDNLEALKLLQESYLGKVKMIYIDPPYNTGADFIYQDDFSETYEEYEEENQTRNDDGERMKVNHDTEGRFHSKWCSMIYPRLLMSRDLLARNGVMFISVDDNEQANMKSMCNEIFGQKQFIAELVWEKKKKGSFLSKKITNIKEYILVYCRDFDEFKGLTGEINKSQETYPCINATNKRDIRHIPAGIKSNYKEKNYHLPAGTVISDTTMNIKILTDLEIKDGVLAKDLDVEGNWRNKQDDITKFALSKELYITQDLYFRRIVKEERRKPLKDLLFRVGTDENVSYNDVIDPDNLNASGWGSNEDADEELRQLFGVQKLMDYPKPVRLIEKLLAAYGEDGIVLDFFSGSATTAHAVMHLNALDGKKRQFILVQIPEVMENVLPHVNVETKKRVRAAISFLDGIHKKHTICEIGKERLRRAGEKMDVEWNDKKLDTGFRVLKVDSSNMNDVYYGAEELTQDLVAQTEDNIKSDRTSLDLLFGCLVDWGVPLSLPYTSETIDGCTVHDYADGALIACFDRDVPESVIRAIAARQPERAVFRDSSFADSPAKINVTEIFKRLSPDTDVRVL